MRQPLAAHLAAVALVFTVWSGSASARDHDGHAYGHRKHHVVRWYGGARGGVLSARDRRLLPPGLAKRGSDLPPGLQKQLAKNGKLPPGLEKRLQPFPPQLESRLPKLPPYYERGVIGSDVIILNRKTQMIVDIMRDVLMPPHSSF